MSERIHPTAILGEGVEIGAGVEIGPYCVVESGATLGAGCRLAPHVHVHGCVTLGEGTHVGTGTALGGPPQDIKYEGEASFLDIGPGCRIHESVSVHRATGEGKRTVVGTGVMLMAGSHVGHNCVVGDHAVLVNDAMIGGHVRIGERALLSGTCAVHQFARVGRLALLTAACMLTHDAPPFSIVCGSYPARWRGPNTVGMRRAGLDSETRTRIRRALARLFASDAPRAEIVEELLASETPELLEIGRFAAESPRGLCKGTAGPGRAERVD